MYTIILLLIVLSGCGSPMLFSKQGATTKDLQNDKYDCHQQWESSAHGIVYRQDPLGHLYELSEVSAYMQSCLERKGYTRVQ